MHLLNNLKVTCDVVNNLPEVTCRVFEDNQSCISVADQSKNPPALTKNIAIKHHHFRSHVDDEVIKINYVDTKKQLADILTKPIDEVQFSKLRHMIMGW